MLEETLGITKSYEKFKNTSEDVVIGAEMFIFLNFCQQNLQDPFSTWIQFYEDLFKNYDPRLILMTLNSILKSSQDPIGIKLLLYVSKMWNLEYAKNSWEFGEDQIQIAQVLR